MQALDRLTSILELVAAQGRPVGAADVARSSDLPLSTTVRLMRQLSEAGLLDRAADGARYTLGARVFALANAAITSDDLAETAAPVMRELRDTTGETISLHVRRGNVRVCLAEVQSEHQVRRVVPPGMVQELCGTATGEALLVDNPAPEVDAAIAHANLGAAARRRLKARLADIQSRGYAINDNHVENLTGLAAPIHAGGRSIAALTVSGPTVRFDRTVAGRHVSALLAAAAALSTR